MSTAIAVEVAVGIALVLRFRFGSKQDALRKVRRKKLPERAKVMLARRERGEKISAAGTPALPKAAVIDRRYNQSGLMR